VFATLNYIYADVFACFDALGSNNVRSMFLHFSPGAWLGIAILMEIPMAMILLSWRPDRRASVSRELLSESRSLTGRDRGAGMTAPDPAPGGGPPASKARGA
jgi:hypothetical protein